MKKTYTSCLRYSFILLAIITLSVSFTKTSHAQAFGFNCTNPGGFAEARSAAADPKWIFNNTNTVNKFSIQWQENGVGGITCGYDNNDNTFKWGTTAIGTGTFLKFTPSSGLIDFTGNVAIGGPSNAKLHVTTSDASNGLRVQNDAVTGDPTVEYNLNGTSAFTEGVDDSDGDKYKISAGAALGTTDRFVIDGTGNVYAAIHLTAGSTGLSNAILHAYDNSTTTAGGIERVQQDGTGDAGIEFNLSGTAAFSIGVDNSDADKFKISSGNTLGTTDRLTISSTGAVSINGALTTPYVAATTTFTAGDGDYYIKADASAGNFTVNLPAASGNTGRIYYVTHIGANTLTIDANGTELIGVSQTYTLLNLKTIMLICDGTGWDYVLIN